jgi:hypothetical protein
MWDIGCIAYAVFSGYFRRVSVCMEFYSVLQVLLLFSTGMQGEAM